MKRLLLGGLVLALLAWGSVALEPLLAQDTSQCERIAGITEQSNEKMKLNARKAFVDVVLTSLTDFDVVDFGVERNDIFSLFVSGNNMFDGNFPRLIEDPQTKGIQVIDTQVWVKRKELSVTQDDQSIVLSGGLIGRFEASRVALHLVQNNGANLVSGYLLYHTSSEDAPWTFVEPIRPLLQPILKDPILLNSYLSDEDASDCDLGMLRDQFSVLFPSGSSHHVLYNADDTNFRIDLEFGEQSSDTVQAHDTTLTESVRRMLDTETRTRQERIPRAARMTEEPDLPTLKVLPVGDQRFSALYDSSGAESAYDSIDDKTAKQAQDDVLNLVDDFYREKVGVQIEVRAPHNWPAEASDGPGSIYADNEVNAFTLMCHFAQDMKLEYNNSMQKYETSVATEPLGISTDNIPVTEPLVLHLFTGYDLASIPSSETQQVSDSGCCFCENACGATDEKRDIIGLAEGLGGLWNRSAESCEDLNFSKAGNHSLSQHLPKPNEARGANKNYQALLFQRFLLVAHEIGHNLGAVHSVTSGNVMYPSIEPEVEEVEFAVEATTTTTENATRMVECITDGLCRAP